MSIYGLYPYIDKEWIMLNDPEPRPADGANGPQRLDNSRLAAANRRRLSAPALRTFLAIADLWGLTEEQRLLVLGYPSRSTYHNWCKQAREHGAFTLDVDVLTRISAVFGIHQALGILFPSERLGVDWLRSPAQRHRLRRPSTARPRDQRLSGWVALGTSFPRRCARRPLHAAEHH